MRISSGRVPGYTIYLTRQPCEFFITGARIHPVPRCIFLIEQSGGTDADVPKGPLESSALESLISEVISPGSRNPLEVWLHES